MVVNDCVLLTKPLLCDETMSRDLRRLEARPISIARRALRCISVARRLALHQLVAALGSLSLALDIRCAGNQRHRANYDHRPRKNITGDLLVQDQPPQEDRN